MSEDRERASRAVGRRQRGARVAPGFVVCLVLACQTGRDGATAERGGASAGAPAMAGGAAAGGGGAAAMARGGGAAAMARGGGAAAAGAADRSGAPTDGAEPARAPDVLYVPTPEPVVTRMLELARVGPADLVYDLGCGDGRIVVMAAQRYGAQAVGFEIDPALVAEARRNVAAAGVERLVHIEQRDIFELDLSPASVVTLYLLPELNVRLLPQLERLKPGSRIVSHDFDIAGIAPTRELTLRPDPGGPRHDIYFFETPLRRTQ